MHRLHSMMNNAGSCFSKNLLTILSIFVLLVCVQTELHAQKKWLSKSQVQYTIEDARTVMEKDPERAVIILNEIINTGKQKDLVKSQAYELLGDINVQNNLYTQSIDRYQRALELLKSYKLRTEKATLYAKIANSYLKISPSESKEYFRACMELAAPTAAKLCHEGLGDALVAEDSLQQALTIFDALEQEHGKADPDGLSRIQAKKANVFALQKRIPLAINSLEQSQMNFDPSQNRSNKSIKIATDNIVYNQNSVQDEIQLRSSNIKSYGANKEYVAEESIQLANAYVKSGKSDLALLELRELKPTVVDLSEDIKADYFKKSAEVFTLQGDYKSALENFEQYEISRNKVLDEKEEALNSRLRINDLQSFVDLSEKDNVIKEDRNTYDQKISKSQHWIIYLLISLLLGTLLATFLIYRNVQAKQKANRLLELRSLRSEMNPHFIFNALGSVNEYIAVKNPRMANRFLSDFSTLMRSAMEMNKKDLIPLQEELAFSELYLKLEHARWEEQFDFEVDWDAASFEQSWNIPPLLVQPYIENAIWHGLRYKKSKGHLLFQVKPSKDRIRIIIEDNGIGRKQSKALKTNNQKLYASTGLKNTKKRAALINALYEKQISIHIEDTFPQEEDTGTRVTIELSL